MKTVLFGDVHAEDGTLVLMDGGIHGVQGHTVILPPSGPASWSRALDGFQPIGRAGSGDFEPSEEERALLGRARDALEELTTEQPQLSFFHPPQHGPPRWCWVIALGLEGATRLVEGGEIASPGILTPLEIRDALEWLRRRVDELSERDG